MTLSLGLSLKKGLKPAHSLSLRGRTLSRDFRSMPTPRIDSVPDFVLGTWYQISVTSRSWPICNLGFFQFSSLPRTLTMLAISSVIYGDCRNRVWIIHCWVQLPPRIQCFFFQTSQGDNLDIMKIYSNQIITIDCSLDVLMR